MRSRFALALPLLIAIALAAPVLAHGPSEPPLQSPVLGDFKLESGDLIKDSRSPTSPMAASTPTRATRS